MNHIHVNTFYLFIQNLEEDFLKFELKTLSRQGCIHHLTKVFMRIAKHYKPKNKKPRTFIL